MITDIYYPVKDQNGKYSLAPCCGKVTESKYSFILPGRDSCIIRIVKLPPVAPGKLRGLTAMKIKTLYPGKTEKTTFDFIPYKTDKEWTVVIYILDNTFASLAEAANLKKPAILLPLQLIPGKTLKRFSTVIYIYPDMVETFMLNKGVPEGYRRNVHTKNRMREVPYDRETFVAGCANHVDKTLAVSGLKYRTFSEIMPREKVIPLYFQNLYKSGNRISPLLSAAAAISLSTLLLIINISGYFASGQKLREAEKILNTTLVKKEYVKQQITKAEKLNELIRKNNSEYNHNPYQFLYRLAILPGLSITITSFTYSVKNGEILITCTSRNPAEDIVRIKKEFPYSEFTGITSSGNGSAIIKIRLRTDT